MPGRLHQLSRLAAGMSVVAMLSGCGGGASTSGSAGDAMPGSAPDEDATSVLAGVPEDHGLSALDAFTVPPGSSVQRGNVEVSCPAGGPACAVSVAGDGTVEYETSGGIPSLVPAISDATEIEAALSGLLSDSGPNAIARFSAPLPPPDAITCKALLLGCEGGLGPVHDRSAGKLDFSGFEFIGRRRGVSWRNDERFHARGTRSPNTVHWRAGSTMASSSSTRPHWTRGLKPGRFTGGTMAPTRWAARSIRTPMYWPAAPRPGPGSWPASGSPTRMPSSTATP